MKFLIYPAIAMLTLFLDYRISLSRGMILSLAISVFISTHEMKAHPYETFVYALFINALPFAVDIFKRDFRRYKGIMRTSFEKVKSTYDDLVQRDRREVESNLEREKKLQQVLSLYEISKEMSTCRAFEDIFNIFCSTLKKSFRFRLSRILLLRDSGDIDNVYQVELGRRVTMAVFDDFDRELLGIAMGLRKTISISPHDSEGFSRRLSFVKNFDTLISVPLFVEEKLAGVLYIENIPRMYFENFIILANQFAIQFQKVFLYKKVQEISITDSLTEVSTRRYFLERLSEEMRRSMRHKSNLSFLMLDIDHFKQINDRFGHMVGDVVLKDVASILRSNLREIDVIGRYGGEEFSIVLTGIDRDGAFRVAERIRENVEGAIFKAYDETVTTTLSIGVSIFPEDAVDPEDLIEKADKALYKAKETGRNRVC